MKKVYLVLIMALAVLTGTGIAFLVWGLRANETFIRDVELTADGVTTETLSFTAENFVPGETREYTVTVHCAEAGEFVVTFSYESAGEGDLWKYLDVGIRCGEVTKEAAMAELHGGAELKFEVELKEDEPFLFTVRYTMPLDVGNEAQRESADFALLLTAERK